jgi:hypothetical protein
MRASVAVSTGIVAGIVVCAFALGLGAPSIGLASSAGAVAGGLLAWRLWTRPIAWLDGRPRRAA